MKKENKSVVKKSAKPVVKKIKISSYEKRYDFIRDELYSLMLDEESNICPTFMASQIILDCAMFGTNSYLEGLGLIAEAENDFREIERILLKDNGE
jgi:hypothetical protein